jgi:hypothetical protein
MKFKSKVWCVLYIPRAKFPWDKCFNLELGQNDGPFLSKTLVRKLGRAYLRKHKKRLAGYSIHCILPGNRDSNGL